MAEPVVGLSAEIKLQQLRDELAKIPGLGADAARDMTRQLSKELKAAEAAAKKAALSGRELAGSFKTAETAFGKAGSSASKAAGLLGLVSPEAASAARALNDLADGGEVASGMAGELGLSLTTLGAATVALSAAAVVGYGVWNYYAASAQQAAEQSKYLADTMATATGVAERLGAVQIDADVATGKLTHEQGAYEKAVRAASKAHDERAAAVLKEQGLTQAAWESWSQAVKENPLADTPENVRAAVTQIGLLNTEMDQTKTGLGTVRDATTAARLAQEAKTKADKDGAKAEKELAEKIAVTNAEFAFFTAAAQRSQSSFEGALSGMIRAEAAARDAQLSGVEKVEAARKADLADLEATYRQGLDVSHENTSARETLEEQHRQTIKAINDKYDAEAAVAAKAIADTKTKAAEDAARAAEEADQQAVAALGSYAQQGLSMVEGAASDSYAVAADTAQRLQEQLVEGERYYTDAQKAELDRRQDAAKDQALQAFGIAKAAKMGEIALATTLGAMNALAQSPPPSPLGAIGAAMVIAAGVGAEAEAAAQQPAFHSGGEVLAPDEVNAKLRAREMVATPTGASLIGPEIRKANAGVATGGGVVVALTTYQHSRQAFAYKRDALLRHDPVAQQLVHSAAVGMES